MPLHVWLIDCVFASFALWLQQISHVKMLPTYFIPNRGKCISDREGSVVFLEWEALNLIALLSLCECLKLWRFITRSKLALFPLNWWELLGKVKYCSCNVPSRFLQRNSRARLSQLSCLVRKVVSTVYTRVRGLGIVEIFIVIKITVPKPLEDT